MSHVDCSGSESTLKHCGSLGWGKHGCNHNMDAEVICSGHRKSRLTDGFHPCSGRVEVLHGKSWVTVCDADFDQQDAEVVCRELGCGLPVEVLGAAAFGRGEGQVWSEELQCRGNESEISLCPTSSSLKHNCSHDSNIGLICSGHTQAQLMNSSDSCSGRVELQYLSSSLAFHEGRVRLSGGMECEGEVEVYFMQDWRRVLLDSWSESEASVVCRQLGCGSVFSFSSSSTSSPERSHMCVTGFNCSGSEAHLRNCSSAQAVNCSSREQLSITCLAHSSIRLVGSGGDCAGRLEVFHNGSWGTVSDDLWDIEEAQVVCRQLQCGVALSALVPAWFGPGTGPIWLNEVECEGNETSLWNCRFQLCGKDECGHKDDIGVVCSEFKEIRLTEGCQGNLEVFYNETWGNVCVNGMDEETASLICQELNCGRSGSLSQDKARVQSAPNWLDDLKCRKHDSTLWHCPSSPWGQNNCDNSDDVAHITCSGEKRRIALQNQLKCSFPNQRQCSNQLHLRLRGGNGICSGRLEVYHNTEWGSVCDNQWDIKDAQVVCRQLGCGPALSAGRSAVLGAGEGPIWLNRVKCRGTEIHLWDCPHSLKNHTDCSHSQDAGVTCTVFVQNILGRVQPAPPAASRGRWKQDLSVSSTVTSKVTTITITAGQTEKGAVIPPQTPISIYPVSLLVLGVLLFLALGLLFVLFYRNRVLMRVLSKRTQKTLPEAVYEEIDQRLLSKRKTQRGSVLSEEQHSGYEDVDEKLLSAKAVNEEEAEYYDDASTSGLKSEMGRENTPESYDDVMTAGQTPDRFAKNKTEIYDDAISAGENPHITTVYTPESYDDVITPGQDLRGAADYDDVGGI
ncbi:scavenger receptor cysteine-rich type 1 protein M130-like [Pygocentrus nattereri]|uniref:scavenger receptor cysteine-rich type 1 protein M130-like n=1 Tax=Pygocentrus nattereri TaxID=42514 RepID=UPI001890C855|nr:scavenger receptor cysteine-rich type 1 protein M130-like [Pygocentrus nattereri]